MAGLVWQHWRKLFPDRSEVLVSGRRCRGCEYPSPPFTSSHDKQDAFIYAPSYNIGIIHTRVALERDAEYGGVALAAAG
jgi:hypothetical protein